MILLRSILFAGIALTFSSGAQASSKEYSEKCDDYASLSYSSRNACLKDGRWHVIYETNAQGVAVYGSVDVVESHITSGADFKVIAPYQRLFLNSSALSSFANINEKCQQIYRSQNGSRPIYCLSPLRFSGEQAVETAHGSARYGTDGRIYCNGLKNPGSNGCTTDPIALKFLIRY